MSKNPSFGTMFQLNKNARIFRSIIGDGVSIKTGETFENVAIVKADMVKSYGDIPRKGFERRICWRKLCCFFKTHKSSFTISKILNEYCKK